MDVINSSNKIELDNKIKTQAIDQLFEKRPDAILKQLILPTAFVVVLWQTQNPTHLIICISLRHS